MDAFTFNIFDREDRVYDGTIWVADWDKYFPVVLNVMNCTINTMTGFAPVTLAFNKPILNKVSEFFFFFFFLQIC